MKIFQAAYWTVVVILIDYCLVVDVEGWLTKSQNTRNLKPNCGNKTVINYIFSSQWVSSISLSLSLSGYSKFFIPSTSFVARTWTFSTIFIDAICSSKVNAISMTTPKSPIYLAAMYMIFSNFPRYKAKIRNQDFFDFGKLQCFGFIVNYLSIIIKAWLSMTFRTWLQINMTSFSMSPVFFQSPKGYNDINIDISIIWSETKFSRIYGRLLKSQYQSIINILLSGGEWGTMFLYWSSVSQYI